MLKKYFGLTASTQLGLFAIMSTLLFQFPAMAEDSAPATAARPGVNSTRVATIKVDGYEVDGNSVLPPEAIDRVFADAVGPAITIDQIRKAVAQLQLAYRERGYASIAVGLPPQHPTNGIVRVKVTEGRLAIIRVKGNRYFTTNNVLRALPSLQTNILLNSHILQRELDIANANRDRQIYPTIEPGPEPGTSAITLQVKDRLPLHAHFDVDNYGTPGAPDVRMNFAAEYDNLWQREQQLGISYGFTPQESKAEGLVPNYFFNQPLVSYYGAYYRLPFGGEESVDEQIRHSANFGYNEATHEFRLPPAGGRPSLTVYASESSSDTGLNLGVPQVVAQTPLLDITSQDAGRNLSVNDDLGGRFNVPVALNDNERLNFSAGVDFKRFSLSSYNTNNFYSTIVTTNNLGATTNVTTSSSPVPPQHNEVEYLPLNVGADFSEDDQRGLTTASVSISGNVMGSASDFASLAYSPKARARFARINLSLSREQKVYHDWSVLVRASGQAATCPLISNEQFALGGVNSVRGYYEGDEYGDTGWFGSLEARTPYFATRIAGIQDFLPTWVRASVFVDCGQRFLLDPISGLSQSLTLAGTGFGVSANVNNHIDIRFAAAWALLSSANTQAGDGHIYFTIGGQF